jgi:hypothetical protein
MTGPLAIEVTALAAARIRQAEAWWRANRTLVPDAVRRELQRAFLHIAGQPRHEREAAGSSSDFPADDQATSLLPLVSQPEHIEVVALWHARRGDGPPI